MGPNSCADSELFHPLRGRAASHARAPEPSRNDLITHNVPAGTGVLNWGTRQSHASPLEKFVSYSTFNHVVADKAPLYRAVMGAFVEAKAHFTVHLRPEDIHARMTGFSLDEVQTALGQLVQWGNLQADADTARVTSVEEFYRARFLYQLTREGEAAEQALQVFDRELGRRGALQSVALDDIRLRLRSLAELADHAEPDGQQVQLLLRDLATVFADLAENARAFMSGLSRTLELRGDDQAALVAYKERLIHYIERFIGDLVTASAEIAGTIHQLDDGPPGQRPIDALLRLAAERDAADQAPDPDSDDDAQTARVRHRSAALHHWEGHWQGLKAWFVDTRERRAQAAMLRAQARRSISRLLEAIQRLNERRLGRSDRAADFRVLARWFLECPDDAAAHRLWHTAFGLNPARHLVVDADTLESWTADPVPASRPWAKAPPLHISPRLRATGNYQKRGAPPRMQRRDQARAYLARQLSGEAAELRAARRRLATGEETRLSAFGELDTDSFGLLLQLLGDALASAPAEDSPVTTTTADGSLRIEMTPLESNSIATITTPAGRLTGRDYRLRITELGAVS